MLPYIYIYFFFSSRRRHTRSKRDWSSDVCSSDLSHRFQPSARRLWLRDPLAVHLGAGAKQDRAERSEERRVGKECRHRWSKYTEKKKKQLENIEIRETKKRQIKMISYK